jgi:hypothetical protein
MLAFGSLSQRQADPENLETGPSNIGLPILQCEYCGEYLIHDPVMSRVETILERVSANAKLEIIRYAA